MTCEIIEKYAHAKAPRARSSQRNIRRFRKITPLQLNFLWWLLYSSSISMSISIYNPSEFPSGSIPPPPPLKKSHFGAPCNLCILCSLERSRWVLSQFWRSLTGPIECISIEIMTIKPFKVDLAAPSGSIPPPPSKNPTFLPRAICAFYAPSNEVDGFSLNFGEAQRDP